MQFMEGGPDVPLELIVEQEKGGTIFVCGAGVSKTVGLPLFDELVQRVYGRLGEDWRHHPAENEAMEARQFDRVLRCLERRVAAHDTPRNRNMRERIRVAVAAELQPPANVALPDHAAIIALSRDSEGRNRLLTTNFDLLFERAWFAQHHEPIQSHAGPALPQPRTSGATGILHLHGRLADYELGIPQTDVVVTSAEFGDAYLRTGWASRYVYDLARAETLVLLGYQADDPPMRYLLEALEADRERFPDLKRVYAFGACQPGDEPRVRAQWEAKGVHPILYPVEGRSHDALYSTIREWKNYAEDPTRWRLERLRELFASAPGSPSQDEVRTAQHYLNRGDSAQLIAELSPSAKWLPALIENGVFKATELPGLWISRHLDDPEMIKICAGLDQIDRTTKWHIERELERSELDSTSVRARAWRIITSEKSARAVKHLSEDRWLDNVRSIRTGQHDFHSRDVVAGVLRPRLITNKPIRIGRQEGGIETLHSLARIEFEALQYPPVADILQAWPDTAPANLSLVRKLTRTLEDSLDCAQDLGLLGSWDVASHDVPSVAEHEQNRYRHGFYPITRAVADLWTRLGRVEAEAARKIARQWFESPYLLLQRIALFAFESNIFELKEGVQASLKLSDYAFWVGGAQVEVMRLLTRSWGRMNEDQRGAVEERLRGGVPRDLYDARAFTDHAQWESIWDSSVYRRLSRLASAGGLASQASRSLLDEVAARHPQWAPSEDDRDDFSVWRERRPVQQPRMDLLGTVPDEQLVEEAYRIQSGYQFQHGDLWFAFCKSDPARALRGLVSESEADSWRHEAWDRLIWAAHQHEDRQFQEALAEQVVRMPGPVLESLGDTIANWYDIKWQNLPELSDASGLRHEVWNRLADVTYQGAVTQDDADASEDLLSEAISRAGGILASVLVLMLDSRGSESGSGLPEDLANRFELIAGSPTRSGQLGRVQFFRQLAFLEAIAPDWVSRRLTPLVSWAHPEAEAVWEGFAGGNVGTPRLFSQLKAHMLAAFQQRGLPEDVQSALFDQLLQILFWLQADETLEFELSPSEVRHVLAASTRGVRRHASWRLWRIMADDEGDPNDKALRWRQKVAPIFSAIWPLDAAARDAESSQNLVLMVLECEAAFPEAVEAVADLLVPYQLYGIEHSLRLERHHDDLVARFPRSFTHLVSALIDPAVTPVPDDLPALLQACVEADQQIVRDPAYVRLFGIRRMMNA